MQFGRIHKKKEELEVEMATQSLLWMKNLTSLDSDYWSYCIYLSIEIGFNTFFGCMIFNTLYYYSELTVTNHYWLIINL